MRLPLSAAQLGVWHAMRIDPASPAYDIGGYAEIRGPLDADLLARAGTAMVAEVPAFRVRVDDRAEPVAQVIVPPAALPLAQVDLAHPAEAAAWIRGQLATPHDPVRDPVLEVALLRVGDDRHWWYVRSHHLVLDGYSVPMVCGRVAEIYTALARGTVPGPSPFGPYRLLLDAENAYRASPDFAADRRFWLDRMALAHDVPTLSGRTGPPLGPFHRSSVELPSALAGALLGRGPGRAWVPVVMAAFAGYLARLTGAGELRLGVPMAGRSGALLRVPGNAANLLPLRASAPGGRTAAELTAAVGAELREVRRHQRYRGEDLAREVGAVGIGPALYGPSVNIRDFDHGLVFGEAATVLHDVAAGPVEDLTLSVRRQGDRFGLYLDGNAGAYARSEIETHLPRFVDYLTDFCERLAGKAGSGVGVSGGAAGSGAEFSSRSAKSGGDFSDGVVWSGGAVSGRSARSDGNFSDDAAEADVSGRSARLGGVDPAGVFESTDQARVRRSGGHRYGAAIVGRPPHVAEVLAAQARRTPLAVALRDQHRSWTFVELAGRVDRLAGALRRAGVGPEVLVAVVLPRSAEYVIALLAVCRAGGAWLPLDPGHPPERLAEALRVSRPALVIAADPAVVAAGIPVLSPDAEDDPVWAAPDPANLAYVIHTSGSTGRPRAVEVTYGGLANLLHSHRAGIMPADRRLRVGHTAPFTVDAAVDPVLWMVAGHQLILLPEESYRDPYALVRTVRAERLDLVDVPPSYLAVLLDAGLLEEGGHRPGVVVFGGEGASAGLWARLRAASGPRVLLNAYGPTEFTVDALIHRTTTGRLTEDSDPAGVAGVAEVGAAEAPALGEPVAGSRALVLDGLLRPVPEGGVGELYLGGPGIARGYAGQPGYTAARFVADPLGPPGARLFRTGDRVRVHFGGALEFLGRTDDQLKIRGFRVEPREVEAVLAGRPGVLACAVLPRPGPGGPVLVAYVVPRAPDPDLPGALLVHARTLLPDHLVPAAIVPLPALPLTPDGVLDRRALPAPAPAARYRAPTTATEAALCSCFAEVLAIDRVGVDDDFFALGGHSLLAARLQTAIHRRLGIDLGLRPIFTHRTAQALAQEIESQPAEPPLPESPLPESRLPESRTSESRLSESGA